MAQYPENTAGDNDRNDNGKGIAPRTAGKDPKPNATLVDPKSASSDPIDIGGFTGYRGLSAERLSEILALPVAVSNNEKENESKPTDTKIAPVGAPVKASPIKPGSSGVDVEASGFPGYRGLRPERLQLILDTAAAQNKKVEGFRSSAGAKDHVATPAVTTTATFCGWTIDELLSDPTKNSESAISTIPRSNTVTSTRMSNAGPK